MIRGKTNISKLPFMIWQTIDFQGGLRYCAARYSALLGLVLPFRIGTEFCFKCHDSYICLCRREVKDKPPSQLSAIRESTRTSPLREVGGVENVGKRQFAVRCHVEVWRFAVDNDDDVRDAVVVDIIDEMEVTTETPPQEAKENEMEFNEVTASPPCLRSCTICSVQFRNLLFHATYPMRVVIFRELYMCFERRFASRKRTAANAHYEKAFPNVLKSFSDTVLPTWVSANSE